MTTKSIVLSKLERYKGEYISGEKLADECGVSRNSIWKAVKDLKDEGYVINSVNNKGYMLEPKCDIISEEGIRLYLKQITSSIYIYDSVDSTNTEAKRLVIYNDKSLDHGSLIVARRQKSGRGHDGSSFESPEGGIYMSVILNPEMMKVEVNSITEYVSKAVKEALEECLDIRITVKEKNRIYQGNRKICGIMTEGMSDLETGIFSAIIVGVGVLTDQIHTSRECNRNEVIGDILLKLVG